MATSFLLRMGRSRAGAGRRPMSMRRPLVSVAFGVLFGTACVGLYPEISTPLKRPPAGAELEPPPPPDMLYIAFKRAEIPRLTRDGRRWDELGMGAPDSFATVSLDGRELFRTTIDTDSYHPIWPHSPQENYVVPRDAELRIELWEQNSVVDRPICTRDIRHPHEEAQLDPIVIECEGGAEIELELAPARADLGLGLSYELRSRSAFITRTLNRSPAERAGLRRGDELLRVMGRSVRAMDERELRTAINANAARGVKLTVKTPGSAERTVELKEGPIYRLAERKL